ncbi:intracellular growth attenuator family protein [Providencia sp. 21OH12SH02B-Prov]|uniref:IgaA/UmoB family intracellular growth attenuator n=1 Tax=Providencia sp. 21OH12SH02B-Prov TaxID=3015951 RepID=UPI0022B61FCA|nr:IgaA/UmoB family intracellular growth attenuator [Providencia sp. 21OH12SH02B-Prov]WBA57006.1 intracellular growth attenuator family protein [Providencia sp. 21OH12SH02B-Prov]
MLNYVIITAIVIISLTIMASFLYFRRGRNSGVYQIPSQAEPSFRKMIDSDYQIISQYLRTNLFSPQGSEQNPWQLKKNAVIATVCNSVTRFNLRQEQTNGWRYFIDTIEVKLPEQLEPYLQQKNVMELVETNHLPLIISLNGFSLKDFNYEWSSEEATEVTTPEAAIHERGEPNVQLLRVRKETLEEHQLNHSSGWFGAILICLSFLLGYLALVAIPVVQSWGFVGAFLCFVIGLLALFRFRVFPKKFQDVQCVFGQPKRWELYGELDKRQSSTVSIGGTDLYYPPHWEPYIHHELDKATNIDMYASGQVLRHGQYLSLHEEERYYPYRRYKKNLLVLATGLLVLILMFSYQSMCLPVKLGVAWLEGSEKVKVTNVAELETRKLKIGDSLVAKGVGMCYRPPNLSDSNHAQFAPFDCSGVYWNNMNLAPDPESEIVERAIRLLNTVQSQLHPDKNSVGVNPRLQRDIMKSGMNIIFDFSEIILRTNELCYEENACSKLKNALINLGSTDDWGTLVVKASTGKLSGAHVLLRAGSAEALENLVEVTTYEFIKGEVEKEAAKLNSPPPGGVLLISDENKALVDFIVGSTFNDMTPLQRWMELKRIPGLLINTPFDIEGIITNLSTDANGTLHITLHSKPDEQVLSRYVSSSLFALFLAACVILNGTLVIIRIMNNKKRLRNIQQYYDKCFEADNLSHQR